MELEELLALAVRQGASDLHLSAGMPPLLRINGELRRVNTPELDDRTVQALVQGIMSERQRRTYEEEQELDFAVELAGLGRFRVNAFHQNRGAGAAFRHIPGEILDLERLGAPGVLRELATLRTGLVLVTGPTGSGKSTTLAAMVDHKNRNEAGHILTIEDPIEFVHDSRRGLVNQREIHRDTVDFSAALRSALREDPDTILVGELRDLETIRLALTAAETGHLVFGTLHTSSAAKTVDRIIDVFPAAEKDMIRSMLAESLRGVVAQVLLKSTSGSRVAAHEILVGTSAVRNLIREDKIAQIYSVMQTGQAAGMTTLDQSLQGLVAQGSVNLEEARRFAFYREAVQ